MGKVVIILLFGFVTLFFACEPHNADDIEYRLKNETQVTIYISLYNELTAGKISFGERYDSNEEQTMSGGGHFTLDSVIIYKTIFIDPNIVKTDSIIYRNPKFGDDISKGNHFFNQDKWLQVKENKYLYRLQEADFD